MFDSSDRGGGRLSGGGAGYFLGSTAAPTLRRGVLRRRADLLELRVHPLELLLHEFVLQGDDLLRVRGVHEALRKVEGRGYVRLGGGEHFLVHAPRAGLRHLRRGADRLLEARRLLHALVDRLLRLSEGRFGRLPDVVGDARAIVARFRRILLAGHGCLLPWVCLLQCAFCFFGM